MKYSLYKYILIVGVVAAMGCNTKELQDLNINPQTEKEIDLNLLLTSAQLGVASGGTTGDNRYIDWRTNIGMCAYAIQHLAFLSGGIAPGDKYTENFETSYAPWEYLYADPLKYLGEIIYQIDSGYAQGKNNNLKQATRIMKAFTFHRLTDYYGSIPYFNALQNQQKNFFPTYDKQKDIYVDLLKELDEATAAFTTADDTDGLAAADMYYRGNIDKWKRWGYSLMLRLALRISNVDAATANAYVAKAVAGGVFTGNDDNIFVGMAEGPDTWVNQNGISRAFIPGDGGQSSFLSKTLIDFLKGTNPASTADDDPRLMILTSGIGTWDANTGFNATKTDPLDQKGMPNGQDVGMLKTLEGLPATADFNPDLYYSKINVKLLDRSEPYPIMNYGEVEFYLAEAAERGLGGLTPAQAKAHYDAGVKASMQMLVTHDPSFVVTDAQVASYLTTYPYGVTKTALAMIADQLWVNHFLNWWEAWSDYRRSTLPALVPTNYPNNITNGVIPQRLNYPAAEVSGNPNYSSGATQPNTWTTKVWWAGGPE